MTTLFGLKIMPLADRSKDKVVWISTDPKLVAERMKFIQEAEGFGANLFEQVESPIIIDRKGWYKLELDNMYAKIHKLDHFQAYGHVYKVVGGRVRNLRRGAAWALNGAPLTMYNIKITAKGV